MRLLNVRSFEFLEIEGSTRPPYACLSHTWDKEEVTYAVFNNHQTRHRLKGWEKIKRCCQQAAADGIDYVWIDTCCIDKSSSAELSEAVNAMFDIYWACRTCYAYLRDVDDNSSAAATQQIRESRWFTRGWTLQELLTPPRLSFFNRGWQPLGPREDFQQLIAEVATIDREDWDLIRYAHSYNERSLVRKMGIARKMSWAACRETTRPEDLAYCLMGLFDVNMPLLYGEGSQKAFLRLQLEIIKQSDDETIFAWNNRKPDRSTGLLANSPSDFKGSRDVVPYKFRNRRPFQMTNKGLQIDMFLQDVTLSKSRPLYRGHLNCKEEPDSSDPLFAFFVPTPGVSPINLARVGPIVEGPWNPRDAKEKTDRTTILVSQETYIMPLGEQDWAALAAKPRSLFQRPIIAESDWNLIL